jgi:hypothetical protein
MMAAEMQGREEHRNLADKAPVMGSIAEIALRAVVEPVVTTVSAISSRGSVYGSRAYSECMRIAIAILGVIVALFGVLWALQGFGVLGGSPMSNTTTWSIIGPIVALIGIALAIGALRRKS